MALEQVFEALGETGIGQFLAESTFAFAVTQSIHLLALAGVGGIVFILALSALGVIFRGTAPQEIAKQLLPWLIGSLAVIFASGLALVSAGPIKYLLNPLFPWKFVALFAALVLHGALHIVLIRRNSPPIIVRIIASLSILAWLAVAVLGRWVGLI